MAFSKVTKDKSWERDYSTVRAVCPYCGTREIQINTAQYDHMISVKNGGTNEVSNCKAVCAQCNSDKGSLNYDEFMEEYYPTELQRKKHKAIELKKEINLVTEKRNLLIEELSTIEIQIKNEMPDLNKIINIESSNIIIKNEYYYKTKRGGNASMRYEINRCEVQKNSKISDNSTKSFGSTIGGQNYIKMLNKLIDSKIIVDGIFTKNYTFTSPSTAASVISKSSTNGWKAWKDVDGNTLTDNERKK